MRRKMRAVGRGLLTVLYAAFALAILAPIVYMLTHALLSPRESAFLAAQDYLPLRLLPERPALSQFAAALSDNPEFYIYFWNTVSFALPSVAGTLLVSALGGYALAKLRFRGRGIVYFLAVFLVMLPSELLLSPQYILARETGLLGTRAAVVLPLIFAPLGLFLMTLFLRAVPSDTLEAARLEGAGEWRVFLRVALPQAAPGIALLAVFSLVESWDLVAAPLVLLGESTQYPLSVALSDIGTQNPQVVYACAVWFMLPVFLCFLLGAKGIIRNLGKIMR